MSLPGRSRRFLADDSDGSKKGGVRVDHCVGSQPDRGIPGELIFALSPAGDIVKDHAQCRRNGGAVTLHGAPTSRPEPV